MLSVAQGCPHGPGGGVAIAKVDDVYVPICEGTIACLPARLLFQASGDTGSLYTARQVQSAQSGAGAGPSATRGRRRVGPREDEDEDEEGGVGVGVERRSWQGAREGIAQQARADVGRLGFLKGLDWLPSERCFRWPNTASSFFQFSAVEPGGFAVLQCCILQGSHGGQQGPGCLQAQVRGTSTPFRCLLATRIVGFRRGGQVPSSAMLPRLAPN